MYSPMTEQRFVALLAQITGCIAGKPLDDALGVFLNQEFPPTGAYFQRVFEACRHGVAAGWMCQREQGGIRYGRVISPCTALHGFSIDVVEMGEVVGPHHRHPHGEINLIMPLEGSATFDGQGAGWRVYGPGSAHRPTVRDGRAYVLYLLPEGAIDFTRS